MSETPVKNHPCDACGKLDDHPMVHLAPYSWRKDDRNTVSDPSLHFDCVPPELVAEFGLADAPEHANFVATAEKAKSGVHGDKLRAFIATLPSDNETEES